MKHRVTFLIKSFNLNNSQWVLFSQLVCICYNTYQLVFSSSGVVIDRLTLMEKDQCMKYTLKIIKCGEHSLTLGECQDIQKDSQQEYDLLLKNYRKESRTSFNAILNVIIETITKNKKLNMKKMRPFYEGHKIFYEKYLEDGKRLKRALIINQSNKRWSLDKDVCSFLHRANNRKCVTFFEQIETLFDKYHKYYEEELKKIYLENILWFEEIILKIKK